MFFTKKNYTVSKKSFLGKNVKIGDYCTIEDDVLIGDGTILKNNTFIGSNTRIGKNNVIHPFAFIGNISQDRKYTGEPTYLEIGDNNVFREYVSINRGTSVNSKTIIGNDNLFMAYSHVGHDCIVEDHVTIANYAALGGHAVVKSYARVYSYSALIPFCRVGNYSCLAANSISILDLIPYAVAEGNPAKLRGVNIWKLKNMEKRDSIAVIKKIYSVLVDDKKNMPEKLSLISNLDLSDALGIQSFIKESKLGVICNEQ